MEVPKSSADLIKDLGINEFELVCLLNKRVREFIHGVKPLIETNDKKHTLVEIAILELLSKKIKPYTPK